MRVNFRNGLSREFPMTSFELEDVLDRLGTANSVIDFRISEYENMDLPKRLCRGFTADIYSLNLFVQRYENLENAELAAMKSLLISNPDSSIDNMLFMTYGLDSVPVFPCENYEELGKFAVENDMLAELEGCPDEVIEFLDLETVGRRMASHEDGMFVDGYYCVPSCCEPPDINIEIGKPENCFFRLLIAPIKENNVPDYSSAQWISLPFDDENQDIDFEKMTCVKRESSLPKLSQNQLQVGKIYELNVLAKELSELPHADFVKLKAVMEAENYSSIDDVCYAMHKLSEYEFDQTVHDYSGFGREYLARNLPTAFDLSALDDVDFQDFGEKILQEKCGAITDYGAVSGQGQQLYSALTVQLEEELEEELEVPDFIIGMGMM